jgi:hypothetical protein
VIKRLFLAAVIGAVCYAAAAALGGFLISQFSSNTHDRDVEAAMTAIFVLGPMGGLIGFGVAFAKLADRAKPDEPQ